MFSGRDIQQLREEVKRAQGRPLPTNKGRRPISAPLPKLGKNNLNAVEKFATGEFQLLRGIPGDSDSDDELLTEKVTAYAMCRVKPLEHVVLHRVAQPFSDGGYWVAMPCSGSTDNQPGGFDCLGISGEQLEPVTLTVSGLTSSSNNPFQNWNSHVNGTHDLSHEFKPVSTGLTTSLLISACSPGLEITSVPNNARRVNAFWPEGPFVVVYQPQSVFGDARLWFLAGVEFRRQGDPSARLVTALLKENPANRITRDSENKIQANDTYSDWVTAGYTAGTTGADFLTWVLTGTWQVN